jgi:hypothetical protein
MTQSTPSLLEQIADAAANVRALQIRYFKPRANNTPSRAMIVQCQQAENALDKLLAQRDAEIARREIYDQSQEPRLMQ